MTRVTTPFDEADQVTKPKTLTPEELHHADGYPGPYVEGDTTGEPDDGRCKTCTWWDTMGAIGGPHRWCLNDNVSGTENGEDSLLSLDGQPAHTGPEFGCPHHEPKSDESERNAT